jgi:hypothetical protein
MRVRLTILLVLTVAVTAMASPAAHAKVVRAQSDASIDGTDAYWLSFTSKNDANGYTEDATLHRTSLTSNSATRIATFHGDFDSNFHIAAGGGRVAIAFRGFNYKTLRDWSKVVAFRADGSGRTVVATGKARKLFDPDAKQDCGTTVDLKDVTDAGAVVVSTLREERSGSKCGRKKNLDRWTYTEIAATGIRREVFARDIVPGRFTRPPLEEVQVNGDYAAVRTTTRKVFLRNLVTGEFAGPYVTSATPRKSEDVFRAVSLGSNGRVVVDTEAYHFNTLTQRRWADVFLNPLNPNPSVSSTSLYLPRFCGSHLVYTDWVTDGAGGRVEELDPQTLAPVRNLAPLDGSEGVLDCSNDWLVIRGPARRGTALTAVPIPN